MQTGIDSSGVMRDESGLVRDQWHRYTWNGDGPLVGVTSILRIQDILIGGDLAAWGGRIAANYVNEVFLDGHPDRGDQVIEDALKEVSKARDIGTIAHDAIGKI